MMGNRMGVLAAAVAGTLAVAAPVQAQDVKVGMITTLSGGGAGLGIDVRDGFLLALKMAGEAGEAVEVVIEDDQRKPDVAVQLADKMIQADDVDVLTGIIWSNLAMAVVPAATAQGKFYLSPNAGPSALAGANCHPNYFNVSWANDNQHEAAGAYANKAGYEKTLILAPNYPAGVDANTGFKRYFEGEPAAEIYTQLGQTDYAGEIAQIRASDADSVFFFLPGGMGIAFMKQYAESGVDIPLIGPAFSFDQNLIQAVGDAAIGAYNTAQWSLDLDNEANTAFVAAFEEEYGRLPSLYASQGYDTANLLLSAIAKAAVSDADAFRAALREADFDATRGDFAFASNQHPIQDFYVRQVYRDGDVLKNRIVEKAFEDRSNAYVDQCDM